MTRTPSEYGRLPAGPRRIRRLPAAVAIAVLSLAAAVPAHCPNHGIVIAADDVTLDLNGHLVDGDGAPAANCGTPAGAM